LIATHKRVEITENLVKKLFAEQGDIEIVLAVSLKTEYIHFKNLNNPKLHIILVDNQPLGFKWHKGVKYCQRLNANPLIILGSDDHLSPNFVKNALNILSHKVYFIGFNQYQVLHNKKKYTIDYKPQIPIGGGRVYSKRLLDIVDWNIFKINYMKHLDDFGFKQVIASGLNYMIVRDIKKVDMWVTAIKGSWSMLNPFNPYHPNLHIKCVE